MLVLAAVVAGVGLGRVELIDPDEGRSALVARLMVERGDWLAPHLPAEFHHEPGYANYPMEGDQFAYWDKPPLYFWMAAAAMKWLGPTALAARLPSGLALVGTALLAWAAGRALGGRRAGMWAGVVTATAPLVVVLGHTARMDALFVMLLTAGLVAGIKLIQNNITPSPCPLPSRERGEEETTATTTTAGQDRALSLRTTEETTASPSSAGGFIRRNRSNNSIFWIIVLYVSVGLGVLAKGPVAVGLAAGAIGGTLVVCGRWREIWRLRPVTGAIIVLAIAAPWFIYMNARYPAGTGTAGFTHVFFVEQHLHRATTGAYGHAASFPGVLVGVLLAGLVPWTIFLPGAVMKLAGRGWRERRENPAMLLVMIWAALVVVGFSLSSTQLPHYVAPALPAVAILLGVYLAERTRGEDLDRLFVVGLWIATGVVGAAALFLSSYIAYVLFQYYRFFDWNNHSILTVCFASVILIIGLLMAATIRGKQRLFPAASLAVFTLLTISFVFWIDPLDVYGSRSSYVECSKITSEIMPGDHVLAYPYTPYSTAWYLWPRRVMHPTADGTEEGRPTVEALYAQIDNFNGTTFCMIQKKAVAKELVEHFHFAMVGQYSFLYGKHPDHTLVSVYQAKR